MSENLATAESPSARSADRSGAGRPLRRRFAGALTEVTVARLRTIAVVALVAYFAVAVPADLAFLLVAAAGGVGVAALVPLAAVTAVTRFVE